MRQGTKKSTLVKGALVLSMLLTCLFSTARQPTGYYPLPDSAGGWRTLKDDDAILKVAGMDRRKLDEAFNFIRTTSQNGGLLVLRHGYLVYEKYFGKGQREATPRLASCGKSFTSIAFGILMSEHPEMFPEGLDQKVFTPKYLPAEAFPLPDARMADIRLGQLLSFTAGIRGNNPVYVNGRPSTIDPPGPDGWYASVDEYALGMEDGMNLKSPFTTKTLWCAPGEGYSYATASIHVASIILRRIAGMELEEFIRTRIAAPLGWGRWGYGHKNQPRLVHTSGGGGIALRSTDMLRFGYLLLQQGRWGEQQIVPSRYLQQATKASPYNPHYPYSLQFNVNTGGETPGLPRDAYWKTGSGGHCLYVVPSLDLVVWKLGGRNSQYSEKDTGLPEPEPLPHAIPAIHDGKVHDEEDDYAKTLRMVIEAISEDIAPVTPLPGQIMADPRHPNKLVRNEDRNGDGMPDPFFLCGPGDPEGFLYRGNRNPDGTRNGDQMELIHKLVKNGGNCAYLMAVRTHGGDAWKDKRDNPEIYPDDLHDPWIDQDPTKGLNEHILDQWESWFTEMDARGIAIYFFVYDDAIKLDKQFGWALDADGNLHPGEKKFIQDLVRRFDHHKNIIWCVMEEGQELGPNWKEHVAKIAEAIREADRHGHIIASHQHPGTVFFHAGDASINQFALQTDKREVVGTDNLHRWMLGARKNSGGRYSIVMSEDWVQGNVSCPQGDRDDVRKRNWAAAMADAYVMVLGMNISDTPDSWLRDCRIIERFFQETTYNDMSPHDELALGETRYVMANEGYDYILYAPEASKALGVRGLSEGSYSLTWLDCVSGKKHVEKHVRTKGENQQWNKPRGFGSEVALYIHREDRRPDVRDTPIASVVPEVSAQAYTRPIVVDDTVHAAANTKTEIQLRYDDSDGGPGPYTITITVPPQHGTLSGHGNDKTYAPDKNYRGEDHFSWKVNDGKEDSNTATVTIVVD